jgi:hypothetical protein
MHNSKTLLFVSALGLFTAGIAKAQIEEDANVSLGNLSGNFYFDSYDNNTKTVKKLNFVVLADGTNSARVTPEFTIKVYIWDGSTPHFVKTFNDNGLYHFGSRDYVDQDIDLSGLQLPAGTYRLGVFVDADDDIPNPPDDGDDNAYLAAGDINFTPGGGGSTGMVEKNAGLNNLSLFPNPVADKLNISWNSNGAETIQLRDISGRLVQTLEVEHGSRGMSLPVEALDPGIYVLTLMSKEGMSVQKFLKQ